MEDFDKNQSLQPSELKRHKALIAGRKVLSPQEALPKIQKEYQIVELYIDNAKTFIQLSTGALVLSVAFMEKLLGKDKVIPLDGFLMASWIFWLLAVLSSALYQYAAVKYLEVLEDDHNFLFYDRMRTFIPKFFTDNPYWVYGLMMVCFFLGTMSFTITAIIRLLSK